MTYTYRSGAGNQAARDAMDLAKVDEAMRELRRTRQDVEDVVIAARKRAQQRQVDRQVLRAQIKGGR